MRKFAGLSLILVMCASVATAYGLERTAGTATPGTNGAEGDALLRNMDSSLVAKIKDYLEIIDQLQEMSKNKQAAARLAQTNTLSGGKKPVAQQVARKKTPPRAVAQPVNQQDKPWWSGYDLSMVFYSDKSRTAVVSGKFVREGDAVRDGIVVKKIERQSVTLEHKGEADASSAGQQDDLKTLYVKAR